MAHRFNFTRQAGSELQRSILELLDHLLQELECCSNSSPGESIHEARKTAKKLRAVLDLAADAHSRRQSRHWRRTVRDATSSLAPLRDNDVLVETIKRAYCFLQPDVDSSTRPWLRLSVIQTLAGNDAEPSSGSTIGESLAELRRIRVTIAQLIWADRSYRALLERLVRGYRRGRNLLEKLNTRPDVELMHEWRKRAKSQLYQVRVLVNLAPKTLRAEAVEFDQLAELLGDHHDLSNLKRAIGRSRTTFMPLVELPGLEPWVDTRMAKLEQEALSLGRHLYAESPKSRRHRLLDYYDSLAHRMQPVEVSGGPTSSLPPQAVDPEPTFSSQKASRHAPTTRS